MNLKATMTLGQDGKTPTFLIEDPSGVTILVAGKVVESATYVATRIMALLEAVQSSGSQPPKAAARAAGPHTHKGTGKRPYKPRQARKPRALMDGARATVVRAFILDHPRMNMLKVGNRLGISSTMVSRILRGEAYVHGCGMDESKADATWLSPEQHRAFIERLAMLRTGASSETA